VPSRLQTRLFLAAAVAVIAAAVLSNGLVQRSAAERSARQTDAAQDLLTAMLDQETGLRGFLLNRRETFLEPFARGEEQFADAAGRLRRHADGADAALHRRLDEAERLARRWREEAEGAVAAVRAGDQRAATLGDALRRKRLMDRLRAVDGELVRLLDRRRAATLERATIVSGLLVLVLGAVFGLGGWIVFGRRAEERVRRERSDRERHARHGEFVRTLSLLDTEEEAHGLVKRHLERATGGEVTVLVSNPSADRLEAVTPVADGRPFAAALEQAPPRSCLAVRLGTTHEGGGDELLQCELCGKSGAALTTCTPLVVSGEVIGSVLVAHDDDLDVRRECVANAVTQAAPVVANMRNLALAELRAATDSLTGLPNRRLVDETARRMVAQASRSARPLAFVVVDLDRFKSVNDRFGHEKGDDVLVAAAQALAGGVRSSDFVGRLGGEEFVVLLPDTPLEGALVAAEQLRASVAAAEVPGVGRVTASFGVAVMPDDGLDRETVLRRADRALYAAKQAGRDRVVAAGAVPSGV
jgi:diguanylate cyclase (GGDEF)-like protein